MSQQYQLHPEQLLLQWLENEQLYIVRKYNGEAVCSHKIQERALRLALRKLQLELAEVYDDLGHGCYGIFRLNKGWQ